MSHDQKPARVRVVTAASRPTTKGGNGTEATAATEARQDAAGTGAASAAKPRGAAGISLMLCVLFVAAAGLGGALAAVMLP